MLTRVADYLRIGEVAQAVGVSVDTLRRWEAEGRVTFERRGNQRVLPVDDLAPLMASLAGPDKVSSARNRFAGVVVSVERDGVMAKVELACGDYRVVSLMSREAADELGLEAGVPATAVIKSTNVVVERTRST
jgi:molybdopterin-binding protein